MTYEDFFANTIERLHDERRHRVFANLKRIPTCFPHARWHATDGPRKVIVWCSNDYSRMCLRANLIKATAETATRMGVGGGGTRSIFCRVMGLSSHTCPQEKWEVRRAATRCGNTIADAVTP